MALNKNKLNYVYLHPGSFNEYFQSCQGPSVVEIAKKKTGNSLYIKLTDKQLEKALKEELCAGVRIIYNNHDEPKKVLLVLDGEECNEGETDDEYSLDDILVEYQSYINGELPEDHYGDVS
uniref:Uncharacterized protein n=1 Tax=Marseillevirus LCMAC101 TaxID=2506602 RepID=A0A481YRV6_9VIRU|nr:MAG: hypothetical protein LCMAC101_05370 [Marseillevirus LCMAC101]